MFKTTAAPESVSTGLPGLDSVLAGLRLGDNVVWRIEEIEDYRRFVTPFVDAAAARERCLRLSLPAVARGLSLSVCAGHGARFDGS